MPVFSTFIGPNTDDPITKHHDLWNNPMPYDRVSAARNGRNDHNRAFTYGDYFSAAQTFLTENNHHNLLTALSQILERDIFSDALRSVNLHLLKHGRFYHPARVVVDVDGNQLSMVLNVAVSAEGRNIIHSEYDSLKRLGAEFPISFIPRVHSIGRVAGPDGVPVVLFLGEWLDDYHEFHLSYALPPDTKEGRPRIVIWNGTGKTLNHQQTSDLVQKASMILTFYYNPETFEQIFPWHHAAGDFVIRLQEDRVALKLISVRGYSPLFMENLSSTSDKTHVERMFEALLLFLLQLSFKMRMDRLDGIGKLVFHSEGHIPAVVNGFFQGLDLSATMRGYPAEFCVAVRRYLNNMTIEELAEYGSAYFARHMDMPEDQASVNLDLSQHMHAIKAALKT